MADEIKEPVAQPTEESVKEQREKLLTYYDEMTPLLEKQLKVEELKAKIAAMQVHRKEAEVKLASLGAPEQPMKKV